MAYDPEARRQSNSALIIAVVSALVLGGGLLAYLATRDNAPETGPTTVVNTNPRRETVVVTNNVPVPVVVATSAPNVIVREVPRTVVVPGTVVQTAPGTNTVTRIERNSTTVRDRVIAPRPAAGTQSGSAAPAPNTNVTINNAPPATAPAAPAPAAGAMDNGAMSADNSASAPAPATGNTAGY